MYTLVHGAGEENGYIRFRPCCSRHGVRRITKIWKLISERGERMAGPIMVVTFCGSVLTEFQIPAAVLLVA